MALQLIDFRPVYRPLSDDEKSRLDSIKSIAAQLDIEYAKLTELGYDGRAVAVAKTNLEQSVMWGVKALTGPKKDG